MGNNRRKRLLILREDADEEDDPLIDNERASDRVEEGGGEDGRPQFASFLSVAGALLTVFAAAAVSNSRKTVHEENRRVHEG